ncbi:MAG TPA: 30S ribosomal protein S16 [Thermodesulfobacteriota bacterium]|nr:30S ribosomal protein S16 [Thermodesulfobacteriota bacterium]
MAVKIRLARWGAKKRPYYRVVVADARSPRDGKFLDQIGHLDPVPTPPEFSVDEAKAIEWLKKGAQPTETVARYLKKAGVLDRLQES